MGKMKPKEVKRLVREKAPGQVKVQSPRQRRLMRGVRLASPPAGEGRLEINTDTRNLRDVRDGPAPEHAVLLKDLPSYLFLARSANQDSRGETAHSCSVSQSRLEFLMKSSRERLLPVFIS